MTAAVRTPPERKKKMEPNHPENNPEEKSESWESTLRDARAWQESESLRGALRELAGESGESVDAYVQSLVNQKNERIHRELLERCGGDEELADRIFNLEHGRQQEPDRAEFEAFFGGREPEKIPQEVVDKARENNRGLLDEYLRYRAKKELAVQRERQNRRENLESSVGSLRQTELFGISPERSEFIRGIWE